MAGGKKSRKSAGGNAGGSSSSKKRALADDDRVSSHHGQDSASYADYNSYDEDYDDDVSLSQTTGTSGPGGVRGGGTGGDVPAAATVDVEKQADSKAAEDAYGAKDFRDQMALRTDHEVKLAGIDFLRSG